MKTKQKKHYRGHGTGTLIKQSTGLFLAKWCYGGKTYVRSTKTHDRDEAEKKLDEFVKPFLEQDQIAVLENLQAKVRTIEKRQENEEQKKVNQTLLKNLFDTYIETQDVGVMSDNTVMCYRSYVNRYVLWMAEHFKNVTTIGEVTRDMNLKFLKHVEATLSNATYNVYLVTLKKMFTVLLHNPSLWNFKSKPEKVVYERRALTSNELKLLLKQVSSNKDLNVLFHLGIYTGMRVSDCSLVRWRNIDMKRRMISIVPKKLTRFNRTIHIPIHPKLFNLLKSMYKRSTNSDEYISSWNAYKYNNHTLGEILKKVFITCKINNGKNKLGFHTLRHTFISVSANNGVPISIVQAIVGHSCVAMTNRYYHVDGNLALNALAKISF